MAKTLGRYVLHAEIGRGAMSVIYRGYDPRIKRPLAIKRLRGEYAEREDYRYRFLSEARAAGTLTHPGIVTIFDVGMAGGVPFIAMELLEAPTLKAFVKRERPLPLRTVLRIATQIADALDYAHRQGVVHQDIKPENIAVTSVSGNVKVMDFGIARLQGDSEPDGSTPGQVAGTPYYMSPEQIRRDTVDGRSDLYSLGVLLYWMLSGHRPFRTDDVPTLLRKILQEPPPALKPLDPDTPDALVHVVQTLLAKDPADRYQSGSELIEDLARIDDMLAERETAWGGRRIIPIRVRWTAVVSVLVAVTLTLGLAVVYHKQNQAMTSLAFDYGLTLNQMLAVETAEDLLLEDHVSIQVLVDEMARNREIVHLAVSDRDGRVVASTDPQQVGSDSPAPPVGRRLIERGSQAVYRVDDAQGRAFLLFDSPVQYQRHELGRLKVGLATSALVAANRTTLIAMIAVMLATLVIVFVGAYVLSRRLVIPIEMLRRALGQITQGRFENRIRMRRNDEFERVFDAYNAMADSLEARVFVAHSVNRQADATGAGEEEDPAPDPNAGTVVFDQDEVGATAAEQSVEPTLNRTMSG